MSKVMIFSRTFPAYHPKSGQPTYFVEKFLRSQDDVRLKMMTLAFLDTLDLSITDKKFHTIRFGNRWKVGDKFSPRVWALPGGMYVKGNKMITIGPDVEVKKVWSFEIKKGGHTYLNGKYIAFQITKPNVEDLAKNDGLDISEFINWFEYPKPFKGQVICWNETINY